MLLKEEILSAYPWLNKELFARIIRRDFPKATIIEVTDFSVKAALEPGENYGSQMIRAAVNYKIDNENVDKSFIIKAMFIKMLLPEMDGKFNVFEKEIQMFDVIVPEVEKVLAEIGDNIIFAAKCYETNVEKQYLILEDLTEKCYKNANRRFGLDIEHYRIALNKIAKYHASAAILREKGFQFKNMEKSVYSEEMFRGLVTNMLKAVTDAVKQMPKLEHFSDKLQKSMDTILQKIDDCIKYKETDFTTLCHGDLWMNNIMFKYDEANKMPIDAILVDYQIPYIGPAVTDVINTLYTSSAENIQDRDWDQLVQYYHKILTETLRKLNYSKPVPTLTSIQMQVLEKGVCFAVMSLMGSALRTLENKGEDLSTLFGDSKVLTKILLNQKSMKTFEFLLDFFMRKGYFD